MTERLIVLLTQAVALCFWDAYMIKASYWKHLFPVNIKGRAKPKNYVLEVLMRCVFYTHLILTRLGYDRGTA